MCILLVAHRVHPDYDLIVAANRDEFYERPSAPASRWQDQPTILAGRDLQAGGTWLGVNVRGHFAAVTNLRGSFAPSHAFSRGHLVRDFLLHPTSTLEFLTALTTVGSRYAGCNLLLADRTDLHWWTNGDRRELPPGVYGLSNTPLYHEWPKVERLKAAFAPLRHLSGSELADALLALLRDSPETSSSSPERELARVEHAIFVHSHAYGTRCSSVVLRNSRDDHLEFIERRYAADASAAGDSRFRLAPLS
ncbi:MAG: NRDE family protein [Gammaproteobacteria bacterium]